MKTRHTISGAATLLLLSQALLIAPAEGQSAPAIIEAVTIHPPVAARFQCSEHPLGAEDHVPDALAADCVVVRRTGGPNGNLTSLYRGDGSRNEDWHSWARAAAGPLRCSRNRHPDQSRKHAPWRPGLGPLKCDRVPANS